MPLSEELSVRALLERSSKVQSSDKPTLNKPLRNCGFCLLLTATADESALPYLCDHLFSSPRIWALCNLKAFLSGKMIRFTADRAATLLLFGKPTSEVGAALAMTLLPAALGHMAMPTEHITLRNLSFDDHSLPAPCIERNLEVLFSADMFGRPSADDFVLHSERTYQPSAHRGRLQRQSLLRGTLPHGRTMPILVFAVRF
jgi:hypothetical protein